MMLQLNPQIPLHTEKGDGYALAVIDYSQEHSLKWVVALDKTGEIWVMSNEHVRAQWNYSLDRIKPTDLDNIL